MEQTTFKTVTFGGFAKEDVMAYIEKSAKDAAAVQGQLRRDNQDLAEQLQQAQKGLASAKEALAQLEQERDALRTDAQAYQRFSQRIGAIECQARERADKLERDAYARLTLALEALDMQYQSLATTFDTSAKFAQAELRKVEVHLAQLPRSVDQVGSEIGGLIASVNKAQTEIEQSESNGHPSV